jgi:hypothetical protein
MESLIAKLLERAETAEAELQLRATSTQQRNGFRFVQMQLLFNIVTNC